MIFLNKIHLTIYIDIKIKTNLQITYVICNLVFISISILGLLLSKVSTVSQGEMHPPQLTDLLMVEWGNTPPP